MKFGTIICLGLINANLVRDRIFGAGSPSDDDVDYLAYNATKSIKEAMAEYPADFGGDLFQSLLTGKELPHLLLTEVN